MLRVAIVGCGKIADAHAAQIQHIPGRQRLAVCDQDELMARQFCERFAVEAHFSDVVDHVGPLDARRGSHHDASSESFFAGEGMPFIRKPRFHREAVYGSCLGGVGIDCARSVERPQADCGPPTPSSVMPPGGCGNSRVPVTWAGLPSTWRAPTAMTSAIPRDSRAFLSDRRLTGFERCPVSSSRTS